MIYLDTSETKETSLLPPMQNVKAVPNLEEMTGADIMISPVSIPASSLVLIRQHLRQGAVLVQGKWSISDFEASIMDDRLKGSISRMAGLCYTSAQMILLYVGDPPPIGSATYSAISKWMDRGGRVEPPLRCREDIPLWLKMKERHLIEYQTSGVINWIYEGMKEFNPDITEDPLQLIAPVPPDDPRRAIIQCPGIGRELATRWWETMNTHAPDSSLWRLLTWMSCEDPKYWNIPKVEGYAQGKRQAVRQWLGLPDGLDLDLIRRMKNE